MPNPRVIDDSEDEDAGFSPINSPAIDRVAVPDGAPALPADAELELHPADSTIDQRSTDPEFFQKFYEEQQRLPESARNKRVEGISSDGQKSSDPSDKNSSSITDPTLKGSKKAKTAGVTKELANLTQVTTPRHNGADVYDFPSSDEGGDGARPKTKSRTTKTHSKRKRGQAAASGAAIPSSSPPQSPASNQLSLTHLLDEEDALPEPARKRRRSGTQEHSGGLDEDVDLLNVPRTAETLQGTARPQDGNEDQDAVIADTLTEPQDTAHHMPTSFFIAPPNRLTLSQRQEYLRMSGSPQQDERASCGNASPVPQPETQAQKLRSSEATIAYTTPSRYCSSAPGFPELPEDNDHDNPGSTNSQSRKARKSAVGYAAPHSSPDELNSHAFEDLRPQTRRGKNSGQGHKLGQDDWDSDKIGYSREQYNPRPSRRRSGIEQDGQTTQADTGVGTAKRKRQKTDRHHDAVQNDSWDPDKIGAHREKYRPRPSRRRSRAVLDAGDEDLATPERSMPDTCPPGPGSTERMDNTEPILISSGQRAPQEQSGLIEGIDPSYLAALPEDLRQEVIADQLARNSQTSRTRGRGRPSQRVEGLAPLTEASPQLMKRGRKRTGTLEEDAPTLAEIVPEHAAVTTPAAGKKKRGRPKKSGTLQLPPPSAADDDKPLAHEAENMPGTADVADAAEAALPHEIADAPAPSRMPSKRGRKRRVREEAPAVPEEETSIVGWDSQEGIKEAKSTPKRVPKKNAVEEAPSADDMDEHIEGSQQRLQTASDAEEYPKASPGMRRRALTDISNTASGSSQGPANGKLGKERATSEAAVEMQKETTPEVKAKEVTRPASSTTNQQGKVPLRVGLSKRSRIAPLLKIIRK